MPNIVFCDSFDHYAQADITKKWSAITGSVGTQVLISAVGRNSTSGLRLVGTTGAQAKLTIAASASIYIECAVKFATLPGADAAFIVTTDGTNTHVDLRVTSTGELRVTRNGTSLAVTSGLALSSATFYHIALYALIDDSTGAYEVKVNGVQKIVGSSADTRNAGTSSVSQVILQGISGSINADFDDLIIATDAFSGDCRVLAVFPQGAGNYSQWSPSPTYAAPQGTGARTGLITVTSASFQLSPTSGAGTNANVVDGADVTTINGSGPRIPSATSVTSSYWLQFDFGSGVVINECRVTLSLGLSSSFGTWQWQGSPDASSWTSIGTTFALSASVVQTTVTTMSANTTSYRYYRMLGVSGTTGAAACNLTEVEFSVTGAAGNLCVDESSMNSDVDYVSSSTASDRNSYDFATVGSAGTVKAVQHVVTVRKDDAGSRNIKQFARISGTDYDGSSISVTDTYLTSRRIMLVNPATSTDWTMSTVDSAEFGTKLES